MDNIWDVWEAMVLKYSLNIFLILQKAYNSKYFGYLIIIL